jgi:dethiobiotin synthetase
MKIFVTGISTDVGKTMASAIITEALEADYWKPVQAGDLHNSDSFRVVQLISNGKSTIHSEAYTLTTAASPHVAAAKDGIQISMENIIEPTTSNHLVIEGAGGVFVPLNDSRCVIDIIKNDYKVVVVSRHYLGSINHTMLTLEALKSRNLNIAGIIFSGDENEASESFILQNSNVKFLGRIDNEPYFDKNVIADYADIFRDSLYEIMEP